MDLMFELRTLRSLFQHTHMKKFFCPCFLQGVEWLQAYIPDAVWYNYESVSLFWTLFKQFPLNTSTSS